MTRTSIFIITLLVAAFLLVSIPLLSENPDSTVNQSADIHTAGATHLESQADRLPYSSTTTEPGAPSLSLLDGPALLDQHCTQCHLTEQLFQAKRSRAAWEMALVRMEKLGVGLSEDETSILIDYLVSITDQ